MSRTTRSASIQYNRHYYRRRYLLNNHHNKYDSEYVEAVLADHKKFILKMSILPDAWGRYDRSIKQHNNMLIRSVAKSELSKFKKLTDYEDNMVYIPNKFKHLSWIYD